MIQLNLKGNNAQGLRNEMNDQCGQKNQQEKNILAMNFTISDVSENKSFIECLIEKSCSLEWELVFFSILKGKHKFYWREILLGEKF